MTILNLRLRPELIPRAAVWFSGKWGVPVEAYVESMERACREEGAVPGWYLILDEKEDIAAGLGIIENDFHKRPDLTPNLCALYVEAPYRKQGLARALLDRACADLKESGIMDAYLITSHTTFYEKCGWSFYGMIEEDTGDLIRMYHRSL